MNQVTGLHQGYSGIASGAGMALPIEDIMRIAAMVVDAGLAPDSVSNGKQGESATNAVAVAIMAGAELGLPPMASLRSFTIIGGRPALFGDGLINVVRRSRKAAFIRTGYDSEKACGFLRG